MSAKLDIVTFGCRLNAYESEVMRTKAAEAGLEDAIVFNTCAVTAEAVRQARQAIRKARRARPNAKILVTGCAAQIDPQSFADMVEVDRVLGNQEKLESAGFAFAPAQDEAKVQVQDIMGAREISPHLIEGFEGRARAFVQVQNGCDHRCTFCVIPFGRGPSRSAAAGPIVEQIQTLVAQGYHEVVLTGVDLTSYGEDLPGKPRLGDLVRRILKLVPGLARLRLSSLDSIEADEALFAAIAEEPRLMPHFHVSLQAGDDLILKRMKRRHVAADAEAFVTRVRMLRADAVFGADIIAGFPTESDAAFENSLSMVTRLGLTYLHVFPYSPRPGTPAARMPQVPRDVIKDRAERLRQAGARALADYLASQVGQPQQILMESETLGRTAGFAPVAFASARVPGTLLSVVPHGADARQLLAA